MLALVGGMSIGFATVTLAEPLPLAHIPDGQMPDLKSKAFNGNFALEGAAGNAVIRSRYGNDVGGDGQKIYVFGYQVDLTNAYEVNGAAGISAITLDLPKAAEIVAWPKLPGQVKFYVIDEDGSNKGVPLTAAEINGDKITFRFATPVSAGKTPGSGEHSQWFGFVSATRPGNGPVEVSPAGQIVKPPAAPSTAAGGKPADNQNGTAAVTSDAPTITVLLPLGDQPGGDQKSNKQKNGNLPGTNSGGTNSSGTTSTGN
ncbi:MAG TPA: hypothetical protein VL462_00615 [Candidatus Nitrosotalea sp.]|jgi:hypothetical protein|nr:hypothetical protein [Candidatus Nitrosotalea sp.]